MQDVVIVGTGMTRWGRYPDNTITDLSRQAIMAALQDADLNWKDIQFLIAGIDPYAGMPGLSSGTTVVENMGYSGIPATSCYNACATGAFTLTMGRSLILSGEYDTVLCVGSFKAPGGFFPAIGNVNDPKNLESQRFRIMGKTNPAMFAFQAMRRMHNSGMTEKDMALVKVKNSKNGKLNPYARYQKEFTMDEVLNSEMLAYPVRLFEICATSDGAAAVILTSAKKARKLTTKPIKLAASAAPMPKYPNMDYVYNFFSTQSEISTKSVPSGERSHERQVATAAYEQAGVGPEDLGFAEVYDLITSFELDFMEDIGVCKPGDAERLLRDGETAIGGKIPINPSGGLCAFGESVSAQGLAQICELVRQLRGDAKDRQVNHAKVGLAINKGLGNSLSCMICKK